MITARKAILSIVFFFTCFIHTAQNLVPNADFETYSACPWNLSMLNTLVANWTLPNSHLGSSDYYNACYTTGSASLSPSVPTNGFGYQQAYNGVGYAGIYLYTTNPPTNPTWDYREYISVQLTSPMVAGVSYSIGFYVSPAENHKYASDAIGGHLSVGPLTASSSFQPISVVPQITNPVGNFINDTLNWTLISGVYIANGGENYLTIGNFKSNVNTGLQIINPNPILGVQNAYLYVDGAVVDLAYLQVTGNNICVGDSVTLQAGGSTMFAWADSLAPATILSTAPNFTVSPAVTTTYFVYGDVDTVSYTVHVSVPTVPLVVDLGNDTTLCTGETLLLDATVPTASYAWQDSSTNPTFNVVQAGSYYVSATIGFCTTSDTIQVSYISPPPVDLGSDVSLCVNDTLVLDATAPNASYVWQDNSTNATFTVTQTGTYFVSSSVFNCSTSDTITVSYVPVISIDLGPDLSLCAGETPILDATTPTATYLWQNGANTPQFMVSQTGQYFVEVTTLCETVYDTVTISYFVPPTNYLGNDTIACWGTSLLLTVNIPGTQTQWQDQSLSNTYLVNTPGTYVATSTTPEGCVASDEITIDFITVPALDLGLDRRVCDLDNYYLINLANGQGDYVWSTGSVQEETIIRYAGVYSVELSNKCGTVHDTVEITDEGCNCLVYLPNAFTPDVDEHNSLFGANYDCTFTDFNLVVYNRWGEVIWESNDPDIHWDGTFDNKPIQDGAYVYKLKYSSEFVFDEVVTGHFVVIR